MNIIKYGSWVWLLVLAAHFKQIYINCIQNAINMMTQYKDLYNIMSLWMYDLSVCGIYYIVNVISKNLSSSSTASHVLW